MSDRHSTDSAGPDQFGNRPVSVRPARRRIGSYVATAVCSLMIGLAVANRMDRTPRRDSTPGSAAGASTGSVVAPRPIAELPIITSSPRPTNTTTTLVIAVHAAGAFQRPGVYLFPLGARVDDLLVAAGGVRPEAQTDMLNLAAPLADGQRVWVPVRGQPIPSVAPADVAPPVSPVQPGGGLANGGGPASSALVNLNTATVEQLDALPGVGPSTAAAIVEYRTSHKAFRSIGELLNVRGIGEAKLAAIRAKVTL